MVTLEFHDPSGTLDKAIPHASRLASFAGKKVGMLSNGQWQAYRMLPMLKTMLETDLHGIEVISEDNFTQGNAFIGNEDVAQQVRDSKVDAVIIGNAA